MKTTTLWILCLPANLLAWLFCAVVYMLWGRSYSWGKGLGPAERNAPKKLCVYIEQGTWPARTWFKNLNGMCCGPNAVLFSPRVLDKQAAARAWGEGDLVAAKRCITVHRHEFHHCEQAAVTATYSAVSLLVLLLSGANPWITSALIVASWPLKALSGNANAWLRGGDPYLDSVLEKSAYAVGDKENGTDA